MVSSSSQYSKNARCKKKWFYHRISFNIFFCNFHFPFDLVPDRTKAQLLSSASDCTGTALVVPQSSDVLHSHCQLPEKLNCTQDDCTSQPKMLIVSQNFTLSCANQYNLNCFSIFLFNELENSSNTPCI